jgi:hypothetical protein
MLSGRLSKKVSGGWRSRRLGGRGGPALGMFEPGPGDSFCVTWGFGSSEDEVAPKVVAQTRQRTSGGRGVIWISDGRLVYRRAVRQVYRDAQPTGKRGRPPLVLTPGVGLTQAVKRRHDGARGGASGSG